MKKYTLNRFSKPVKIKNLKVFLKDFSYHFKKYYKKYT